MLDRVIDFFYRLVRLPELPENEKVNTRIFIKRVSPCLGFLAIYMISFSLLEKLNLGEYYLISTSLDKYIPFCSYFVVFYLSWFLFCIILPFCIGLQKDGTEYYRLILNLFMGMTLFILISIAFPNYLTIRRSVYSPSNIFEYLVRFIQQHDTPKNVFPSIHVFNTVCIMEALIRSKEFGKRKKMLAVCWFFAIGIILSTVFLKQHSVLDAFGGIVLQMILSPLFYGRYAESQDALAARMVHREA